MSSRPHDIPSLPLAPRVVVDQAAASVVRLARGRTWSVDNARGLRLEVLEGRIWLTEEGRPEDHFVGAGSHHVVRSGGRVVCEGDAAGLTMFRVSPLPAPAPPIAAAFGEGSPSRAAVRRPVTAD